MKKILTFFDNLSEVIFNASITITLICLACLPAVLIIKFITWLF